MTKSKKKVGHIVYYITNGEFKCGTVEDTLSVSRSNDNEPHDAYELDGNIIKFHDECWSQEELVNELRDRFKHDQIDIENATDKIVRAERALTRAKEQRGSTINLLSRFKDFLQKIGNYKEMYWYSANDLLAEDYEL